MTGTAGQLNFHLGAALNTGTTPEEMRDYLVEIERAAGAEQTEVARGGSRTFSPSANRPDGKIDVNGQKLERIGRFFPQRVS